MKQKQANVMEAHMAREQTEVAAEVDTCHFPLCFIWPELIL